LESSGINRAKVALPLGRYLSGSPSFQPVRVRPGQVALGPSWRSPALFVMGRATPVASDLYGPMYATTLGSFAASVACSTSLSTDHSPASSALASSEKCSIVHLPIRPPRCPIARSMACDIATPALASVPL